MAVFSANLFGLFFKVTELYLHSCSLEVVPTNFVIIIGQIVALIVVLFVTVSIISFGVGLYICAKGEGYMDGPSKGETWKKCLNGSSNCINLV